MKARKTLLALCAFFAAFAAPCMAWAVLVSNKFCFHMETDFTDRTEGDYWTDWSVFPAWGIWARIVRNSDGQAMFDDWVSADLACTPYMWMDTSKTYYVRLFSHMLDANGNEVRFHPGTNPNVISAQTVDYSYQPTGAGIISYQYDLVDPVHETNALAAAAWALREHPVGLSNRLVHIFTLPLEVTGAFSSGANIYLDGTCRNAKTGTTHELGHVVGFMKDGDQGPALSYSDTGLLNCLSSATSHEMDSREWQTAAAVEGNAHFYAALAWNDDSELDCEFRGFDCEGPGPGIYQNDWLSQCEGYQTNKGTELDWMRFWWDLHTDALVNATTVYSIWNFADPHSWTPASVYKRLRDAAAGQGVDNDTWDLWGSLNGVNHGDWP